MANNILCVYNKGDDMNKKVRYTKIKSNGVVKTFDIKSSKNVPNPAADMIAEFIVNSMCVILTGLLVYMMFSL